MHHVMCKPPTHLASRWSLGRTRNGMQGCKPSLAHQGPICGCGSPLNSSTGRLQRKAARQVRAQASRSKAGSRESDAKAEVGSESAPPAWTQDIEGEEKGAISPAAEPPSASATAPVGAQSGEVGRGEQAEAARRPESQAPQPRASTSKTSSPANWLFEPQYGLPIVRRKVKYADLLKEIRENKVAEIAYFDSNPAPEDGTSQHKERNVYLEGYCLVHYQDGTVAQAYLPPSDVRTQYAMETHGVIQTRLIGPPKPNQLNPTSGVPGFLQGKLLAGLPVIFLVAIYVATQIAQWLKGDLKDRQKIREYEIRKEKKAKMQAEADELAAIPYEMAEAGSSVEEICAFLDASKVPYSRDYIVKLVADAKKREEAGLKQEESEDSGVDTAQQKRDKELAARARKAEEADMSEMDRAKELLKMKTVKIQQAAAPEDPAQRERRMKLRKAQSEMKGIKLQYTDEQRVIMFDDVAGIGEAKVDLTEVVDFFTQPGKFKKSGAKIPKGVLLCGPPGTGKTLLARAVAGEARVAFLSLNASELVEMFAGLGASRVRDLFSQARALAPSIIFIDEVDAVGRQRGGAKGNDERDQTLNQMLIEMDGFEDDTGVIVMAATNRLDVLDRALVRPGRFDRIIEVGLPEFEGRIEILKVHLGYRAHSDDIDYAELAFETAGFSGAQLAGLVNDAAVIASRKFREAVCMADFVEALENEKLGNPRRGVYSKERQVRLAVQEASTALISTLLPSIEGVVSTTIVPRETWPLGQTLLRINEQRERTKLYTRRYMEEQLRTVLAGEELVYGPEEMSTINQRKLEEARRIVTKLVLSGAMAHDNTRTLAPLDVTSNGSKPVRLNPPEVGHSTAYAADRAMQNLMNDAYNDATSLLRRNRAAMDELVTRLHTPTGDHDPAKPFQGTTLSGDEVREIVERLGCKADLEYRESQKAEFM